MMHAVLVMATGRAERGDRDAWSASDCGGQREVIMMHAMLMTVRET